jgi:hypothetical protein
MDAGRPDDSTTMAQARHMAFACGSPYDGAADRITA